MNADARITTANIALRKLQTTLPTQAQDDHRSRAGARSGRLPQEKGLARRPAVHPTTPSSRLASLLASRPRSAREPAAITAGQAAVDVARAGLVQARQESLADTTLLAPVAGTVAAVDATGAGRAQAGTTMVTLIPEASYQVVADFSEADAMKVEVGQAATVTFDALTDAPSTGTVTAVDILPTTGSNVTTYGATITLNEVPDGLRTA